MSTGTPTAKACEPAAEERDLVYEALVNTLGAAKLMGEYSTRLLVEAVIEARENGTVGQLAMSMEVNWR